MDPQTTMKALGFSLPSPAYLIGAIFFGLLGLAAHRYGRKAEHAPTKWLGVVLMLYPYIVPQTWLMYSVGVALCIAVYLTRP